MFQKLPIGPTSLAFALAFAAGRVAAQQADGTDVALSSHVFRPQTVPATPERVAALRVPDGFRIDTFARDLGNIRILAVSPHGHVYASRRDEGDVLLLRDDDRDGRADGPPVQVAHRAGAHGIAIHKGLFYLATVRELFVAPIEPDGSLGPLRMLLDDLPDGGQHPNRTLAFGPDGMIYLSVGSSCNACNETNPEHAALLRISPDGQSRTIFAHGLRNTIGFAWHPRSGELWGLDHGIDLLGDEQQPEELNLLQRGNHYGWPHVHGDGRHNPQTTPPAGISRAQWKAASVPMQLGYTAHAAPMQLLFYSGAAFPEAFRGDGFATLRGSWNRKPASGYEVVRIRFQDGRLLAFEPFLGPFLESDGRSTFGRPVGLAQTLDGALLVGDDTNGVIYRVSYAGGSRSLAPPTVPPGDEMQRQARQGNGVPLARARITGGADLGALLSAFGDRGSIPAKHSAWADDVSPPLRWTAVPGARSYALVVEDPDAKPITPFVHWVAWNIPAAHTMVPEGLPAQLYLPDPAGMMQGRNSRGSIGWFGPRPPVGDPPHRYHVQLFALDTELDLPIGADREQLLKAMQGHVLASGELVGLYAQETPPAR